MSMTYEELKGYNLLSKEERLVYNLLTLQHPDWSYSQLITQTKITSILEQVVKESKDLNEAKVIITVLNEAKKWLIKFANISKDIISVLDNAINEVLKKDYLLSEHEREQYFYYKQSHPDWTHEQLIMMAKLTTMYDNDYIV